MRTKQWTSREFKQMLKKNGFEYIRCTGDHFIFKRGNDTIAVNYHLNAMVARRLIKENNLKVD